MAEKTQHRHTLILALTYANDTQAQRDAAAMFCYADVQAFMRRLRQAARRAGQSAGIRFIVAGEQGDRNGRCHWHMILYSDVDIRTLGEFSICGRQVTDPNRMMTLPNNEVRLDWTIWGQGFVTLQEPDERGMAYVLSYCLKDQFTVEKSRGTARQANVENFATGLFRMSKRPAIGEKFLVQKMEALDRKGAVLPNLNIKVPGLSGYWQPHGSFRKKLLYHLVALNKRIEWATGAPAPQWSSLLANLAHSPADRSILDGKPDAEQYEAPEDWDRDFINRARSAKEYARLDVRERCGYALPCRACLDGLDQAQLAGLGLYRVQGDEEHIFNYRHLFALRDPDSGGTSRPGSQPHRYCVRRRTDPDRLRLAFPTWRPE